MTKEENELPENNIIEENNNAESNLSDKMQNEMNPIENESLDATPVVENQVQPEAEQEIVANEIPADLLVEETIEPTPVAAVEQEIVANETAVEEIAELPAVATEETHEEAEEEVAPQQFIDESADLNQFTKKDLIALAEKLLDAVQKSDATPADMKNVDAVSKQIQPIFEEMKSAAKVEAKKAYVAENGSEEGFDFKNDNHDIRFEGLMIQIRETRNKYFKKINQLKEDYFEIKTALLQRLRTVVDEEEKGGSKENWAEFKKIQDEWKDAGNVNSPHNGSLWSAYNALVDRYFSIRSIQNELKDLDRRKNLEAKAEIAVKIEKIAEQIHSEGYSNLLFKQSNDLMEEYKQIGPATREEQEALWVRIKTAFDGIYDKKRELHEASETLKNEIFEAKSKLVENIKEYTTFSTTSINEWGAKTKEVLQIQDQWNAITGPLPREKGREISREFWDLLKVFFKNKSDFFVQLETERENNLKAKTALCEEVEAFVENKDTAAATTDKIIENQKTWRTIGHVPEKYKDSIYDRFKKACDAYFELKRAESSEAESQYKLNLKAKEELCAKIEAMKENVDLAILGDLKKEFNEIGFVPRKDMQTIQKRFVDAINSLVKASGGVVKNERFVGRNESDSSQRSNKGGSRGQDDDLRRKAKQLEDDISLWKNNIEFFGHSKGAEKLKADYEIKIKKAENELTALKEKINSTSNNS
jgi:Domain of Unknown Function (DUF349)